MTTGIANIPDGMASAVLAGVNPVYGIYTLIIGTPVAALSISTQLMMFNTTSAMTLVAVDGLGARQGDDRAAALFTIALVAGVFQLALGLLGLGMLTKFVSNSVMVGFLTGIAALIIMGQLWDLTGYEGEGGSKLEQTAQLLSNLRDVDPATTAIGVGSLLLMFLLARTKLGAYNLLIVLALATAIAWIGDFDSRGARQQPRRDPAVPARRSNVPELRAHPRHAAGRDRGRRGRAPPGGRRRPGLPEPRRLRQRRLPRLRRPGGRQHRLLVLSAAWPAAARSPGTALNVSAGARTRWAAVVQAVVVLVAGPGLRRPARAGSRWPGSRRC